MDILHLNYFLAVAHHKSFTKASQALHVSQPSISKSIRILEKEWGISLFKRHSRTIELTHDGEAILPQIRHIVSQFQQLNRQMLNVKNTHYGTLRIGVPPMVGSSFLSPLLANFHNIYPHITIVVEEWGSNRVSQEISNGALQVGYIALPISEMPVNNYIFNKEPLQIVLPYEHTLAKHGTLSLQDIKDEPFAFFSEDFSLYQSITSQFQSIGVQPNIVCKSSNWDFITEMVRAKLGIALLPSRICQRLSRQYFKVVKLEPYIYWRVAMVWSNDEFISTPSRLWIEYFKENVTEIPTKELNELSIQHTNISV